MKRVLTLLLVGALCGVANPQTKPDKEGAGLLGPVKTIRVEVAESAPKVGRRPEGRRVPVQAITYDVRGNVLERVDYNQDGSVTQKLVYNFDGAGRPTGYEDYTAGLSTPRRHVYVLDNKGNRITYKIIQPDGSAGEEHLYKYDTNGNRIAEALYHKGALISRNENAYDEKGKLISRVIYNPDGTVSSRSRNSIGPEGKTIERIRHDGDVLTYRVRYTYDVKGRLVELETVGSFVETDGSGSETYVTGKVVYIYKGKDQPKETLIYNQDGSLRERVVSVYDSRGNWIRKKHLVQAAMNDKEAASHTEHRTITYH